MDIEKLERAKEIQWQLGHLKDHIDNFPKHDSCWAIIRDVLQEDYDNYKEYALNSLRMKVRLLEVEFSEL